ncbi:MAG: FAD-binding oxidoreductase [Deltaproteobacteria bacterium]|nr:FAD-binding oxidoreductase [Deltaproteobacteria bacterium]
MTHKGPHISLSSDRLVKRVLGLPLEEFQTWPEYLQQIALDLAEELFLIRYNPFISPRKVWQSVHDRLMTEKGALSPQYFQDLSKCLQGYWNRFEADRKFTRNLKKRLKSILPVGAVSDAPNTLIECSTDATDLRMELPALVVFPEDTSQVQSVVLLANELGFSIVPRGGGSGLTGGAVPAKWRTVVMSMSRMKKILRVDPEAMILCAQAGVITLDAAKAGAERGMLFTVDPASKAASSLGGNVSENAGGPFAFEYGTTLDNILSYKMVRASGEVVEIVRRDHPRHKILAGDSAIFDVMDPAGRILETVSLPGEQIRGLGLGKDVTNKWLGGLPGIQKEGVDGLITEACFTLHKQLDHSTVLCMEFFGRTMHNAMLVIKDVAALRDRIREQGDLVKISALEEFGSKYVQAIEYRKKSSRYEGEPISVLIIQMDSDHPEALAQAEARIVDIAAAYDNVDVFVARGTAEAERFWHDRHQLSAIAKRTSGFKINEDIVIPLEVVPEFADFLERLNLHYLAQAYRSALQKVSALPGVDVDDEFVKMELDVTARIIKGRLGKEDIPEQELQLQVFYFFQDLKSRYPALAKELDAILEEMNGTRILIANHMHAGDGNCHVNIPVNSNNLDMLRQAEEAAAKVFEEVLRLRGVISGEHGIGITKISFLPQDKIDALREYKNRVDPNNVFNPGKLTQRDPVVAPYTFSFNRLIRDINKTALEGKEALIDLLTNIQTCTRCGKCKQVCPMYQPEQGLLFHPRNKNITLGALIEALYYSQIRTGEPEPDLLDELRRMIEHCTACGKCWAICPVKIKSHDVTLRMRSYLDAKGHSGHPVKARVLGFLSGSPDKTLPVAAKAASVAQAFQSRVVGLVPARWRELASNPLVSGPGPSTGFRNLAEVLELSRSSVLAPKGVQNPGAVLYFPGCGGGLFYRDIGMATVYLLLRTGHAVLLPPRHLCCGYPLTASGAQAAFERNRIKNVEALQKLLAECQLEAVETMITACGTCREGTRDYSLAVDGRPLERMDALQFLLEHLPVIQGGEPVLYHPACHAEWTGQAPDKAGQAYAKAVGKALGRPVRLTPGCCGESGLGALTSPEIYNRIRRAKIIRLESDLSRPEWASAPILVGCPSCRIGVARSLLNMDLPNRVLHTLEYLALALGGVSWKKDLSQAVIRGSVENGIRLCDLPRF